MNNLNQSLIILDFDRTLFSADFYTNFLELLRERQLLNQSQVDHILKLLQDTTVSLNLLDVLQRNGINTVQAIELARARLNPDDFLYPDLSSFLERYRQHKIILLTTGARRWQMIKLDFCTLLQPYPKIIVQENKGVYLKETLLKKSGGVSIQDLEGRWFEDLILIDDRVDALLPLQGQDRIRLFNLERPDAKYKRGRDYDGITHITSLNEVHI
jgi:hypothetical protein